MALFLQLFAWLLIQTSFSSAFTPIAEIEGYVMGARGQACPTQQGILRELDCKYALRMFTSYREDRATVQQSYEDNTEYQTGCSLNLGLVGIYNDFHIFARDANKAFTSDPNSYPVCYKKGIIMPTTSKNRWWKGECHYFTRAFDNDDCPSGYKINRLENCGWWNLGNKPVCVKLEMVCARGTLAEFREVNGSKQFACMGPTTFGESNGWKPSNSQAQIPCDSPSCAPEMQPISVTQMADRKECASGKWLRKYSQTPLGCASLVLNDPSCDNRYFSLENHGDAKCKCVTVGTDCTSDMEDNGGISTWEISGTAFKFRLKGRSGSEQVAISIEGARTQIYTLSTQWTEFQSPTQSFSVSFIGDASSGDIFFGADVVAEIQSAFWPIWNCGTRSEDDRCNRVRSGDFFWKTDYQVTLGKKCNWQCYLDNNQDLATTFGATNIADAELHWKTNGQREGRYCACRDRRKL